MFEILLLLGGLGAAAGLWAALGGRKEEDSKPPFFDLDLQQPGPKSSPELPEPGEPETGPDRGKPVVLGGESIDQLKDAIKQAPAPQIKTVAGPAAGPGETGVGTPPDTARRKPLKVTYATDEIVGRASRFAHHRRALQNAETLIDKQKAVEAREIYERSKKRIPDEDIVAKIDQNIEDINRWLAGHDLEEEEDQALRFPQIIVPLTQQAIALENLTEGLKTISEGLVQQLSDAFAQRPPSIPSQPYQPPMAPQAAPITQPPAQAGAPDAPGGGAPTQGAGPVSAQGPASVSGPASVGGPTTVSGPTTVTGPITAVGPVTATGPVMVQGPAAQQARAQAPAGAPTGAPGAGDGSPGVGAPTGAPVSPGGVDTAVGLGYAQAAPPMPPQYPAEFFNIAIAPPYPAHGESVPAGVPGIEDETTIVTDEDEEGALPPGMTLDANGNLITDGWTDADFAREWDKYKHLPIRDRRSGKDRRVTPDRRKDKRKDRRSGAERRKKDLLKEREEFLKKLERHKQRKLELEEWLKRKKKKKLKPKKTPAISVNLGPPPEKRGQELEKPLTPIDEIGLPEPQEARKHEARIGLALDSEPITVEKEPDSLPEPVDPEPEPEPEIEPEPTPEPDPEPEPEEREPVQVEMLPPDLDKLQLPDPDEEYYAPDLPTDAPAEEESEPQEAAIGQASEDDLAGDGVEAVSGLEPLDEEDDEVEVSDEPKPPPQEIHGVLELKPPDEDDAPFLTLTYDFAKIPDSFQLSRDYHTMEYAYYKYKPMLVKAQEFTRRKMLKNALNYYRVIKSQNIPPEFKRMINRNIQDITEYLEKFLMSRG